MPRHSIFWSRFALGCLVTAALAMPGPVLAGVITVAVSSPGANDSAFIDFARTIGQFQKLDQAGKLVSFNVVVETGLAVPVMLKKATKPEDKAKALVTQLQTDFPKLKKFITQGTTAGNPNNEVLIDMAKITPATVIPTNPPKPGFDTIRFFTKDAAEQADKITTKDPARSAEIEFQGSFNEFGTDGALSRFTAGILVGSVNDTVTLDSGSITGSLTGDAITTALFDALVSAPQFPSLNVETTTVLDPAMDDGIIYINFPVGLTTDAGIVFGTSSALGADAGVISVVPEPGSAALLAAVLPLAWPLRRRAGLSERASGSIAIH